MDSIAYNGFNIEAVSPECMNGIEKSTTSSLLAVIAISSTAMSTVLDIYIAQRLYTMHNEQWTTMRLI